MALLSESLISWCCGSHWVAVAAGSAAARPPAQQLAARTALLCGVAVAGGSGESPGGGESPRHAWGCAPAVAAPVLLSLLSAAHVPEQAVDSVSGCMFLIARLMSSVAEGSDRGEAAGKGADERWEGAARAARRGWIAGECRRTHRA